MNILTYFSFFVKHYFLKYTLDICFFDFLCKLLYNYIINLLKNSLNLQGFTKKLTPMQLHGRKGEKKMKFFKKHLWVILAVIGVIVFWQTILTLVEAVLVIALVGGIIFFILKIPAVKGKLQDFRTWLRNRPLVCAIALLAILLVILGAKFIPQWIKPSASVSTPPVVTSDTSGSITSNPNTPDNPVPQEPVVLGLDDLNIETSFIPNDGSATTEIPVFSDARTADENVIRIVSNKQEFIGSFVFDFPDSGKKISSVHLYRVDSGNRVFEFEELFNPQKNGKSYFPYDDRFVVSGVPVYLEGTESNLQLVFTFTDNSSVTCFFTVTGKEIK